MTKSKKLILLLLISLTAIISSCTPEAPPQDKPLVFSMLYNDSNDSPFKEDWLILQEYQKRKNVRFDVKLGDNSDYEKSIIQALESGDCPDIILKVWPDTIESYSGTGVLLPFSDYESMMPHFMAYIKENNLQDELDKLRMDNGKYYILPGFQRKMQVQQWIYRRDVFEMNSIPVPETYDELYDALVILKSLYPESKPLTALWGGAHLFAMMGAGYGIPAGWNGTRSYDWSEDLWQYAPATANYREMFTYLNRCYEAGVLDRDFLTQSDKQFYEKLLDGRAFVTVTWITSGFDNWNTQLRESGVEAGEWVPLHVPESTIGLKAVPAVDAFRKGLIVPSSVTDKSYFEDLIKILDWAVYSEEGMTLTTWGVEGITFQNSPEGKVFLPNIKTPKNPEAALILDREYGFDMFFNLNENAEFEDYKKPAEIVAFLEKSLVSKETAELNPVLKLNQSAVNVIGQIEEKVSPYANDSGIKFITGELDIENDWEQYIGELKKRGYETIEKIWNETWKGRG